MKGMIMEDNERSHDIFEQINAYPKPPLMPLPEPGDLSSLTEIGFKPTSFSTAIANAGLTITGYNGFRKQLPENIEHLLRTSNLRGAGLFSLIVSASLALKDDPRKMSPLQRAATLYFGARSLHDDLWSGKLPPDMYKEHILEMGQYPNLFATSLIVDEDGARIYKSKLLTRSRL